MLCTFADTTNVGDSGWGPPLVDEEWHASCQATNKGAAREKVFFLFVERTKAVNVRHPSANRRAKTLWKVREAKERRDAHNDQAGEQLIASWEAVHPTMKPGEE